MSNDILKSVSQGSNGAYDAENRRIKEISDELQRLCRLHEKESRDGKDDGGSFEIEQRVAEQYAKSVGMLCSGCRNQEVVWLNRYYHLKRAQRFLLVSY